MDWQGQKLAEQIMLLTFAVVAFVTGYIFGSSELVLLIYAGGLALTALITIPDYPFYNRHPLRWLEPSEVENHPKPQYASTATKKKGL